VSASRRLAALMFTDMVGYSALARENEEVARELVDEQRWIIRESLKRNGGREHQTTGDGFFIEFSSAINAVQSAIEIQTAMHERERHLPENRRIKIRIGIHLGDILTDDEDLFGNGVNVAARVEPLAKPGGICITRQIYDQVTERIDGISFKKHGFKDLKNIRGGAEVFHVTLPWENEKNRKLGAQTSWFRRQWESATIPSVLNSTLTAILTSVCLASLIFATTVALRGAFEKPKAASRGPAEATSSAPIDLSQGWVFKTATSPNWEKFETHASWIHAEQLIGPYTKSKSFRVDGDFKEPAIVLGLITDTHRAFLNGKFIGGSDRSGDLTYYAFPRELLNRNDDNVLVIEGETRRALNPGLIVLPKVGAFLGEFTDVREKVHDNDVQFHFLRNMYFGLSVMVFLASFAFSIFRKSSMPYMYSAMILLLSTLNLAYYSPWISSNFEYPFLRFLKVIALMHTPLILVSAQLRMMRHTRTEAANNLLALVALLTVAWVTLMSDSTPVVFIESYNHLLAAATLYSFITTIWMAAHMIRNLRKPMSLLIRSFQYAFTAASVIGFTAVFGSIKSSSQLISAFVQSVTTASGRVVATEIGLTLPFLFSVFLVVVATTDHLGKSRANRIKRRRDSMMLELVRLVNSAKPFSEVITDLQAALCEFLKVDRSTLYVFDESTPDKSGLIAEYVHHSQPGRFEIKRRVSAHYGVIGYVIENQTPLNLVDIRNDRRFFGAEARYKIEGFESYKSGACMLFPLRSNGQLIGVLTFADKLSGGSFEPLEFKAALELSASLGLLLDNQQMHRALASLETLDTAV
jgi:class 3 adenylate cyclase